jgi:hypothetical protein
VGGKSVSPILNISNMPVASTSHVTVATSVPEAGAVTRKFRQGTGQGGRMIVHARSEGSMTSSTTCPTVMAVAGASRFNGDSGGAGGLAGDGSVGIFCGRDAASQAAAIIAAVQNTATTESECVMIE